MTSDPNLKTTTCLRWATSTSEASHAYIMASVMVMCLKFGLLMTLLLSCLQRCDDMSVKTIGSCVLTLIFMIGLYPNLVDRDYECPVTTILVCFSLILICILIHTMHFCPEFQFLKLLKSAETMGPVKSQKRCFVKKTIK